MKRPEKSGYFLRLCFCQSSPQGQLVAFG